MLKAFLFIIEPAYEIIVLFVLRKLIRQTRMSSHLVGLDVWCFVGTLVYVSTSCVRTAKALALLFTEYDVARNSHVLHWNVSISRATSYSVNSQATVSMIPVLFIVVETWPALSRLPVNETRNQNSHLPHVYKFVLYQFNSLYTLVYSYIMCNNKRKAYKFHMCDVKVWYNFSSIHTLYVVLFSVTNIDNINLKP